VPEIPPQIPAAARKLARELTDMRARIDRLERGGRAPQLTHAALDGGALVVKDRTGTPLARLGMQHDGRAAVVYARGDPPPAPSDPVVLARQLALAVYWDGTFPGAERPTDLARVDVHVSETAVYTPDGTTLIGSLFGEGAVSFAGDNDAKHVRLVAVTTSDVPSEPTAAVQATPLPADQLAAGSVDAAQLVADLVLASVIRIVDTGGVETVRLDGTDGSAMISGEYKTREAGERIVINDTNTFYRRISFYPDTGTRPAVVQASTQVQDAADHGVIEMRAADPSNGSHETTRLELFMNQLFLGYGHRNVVDGSGTIIDPAYWSGQIYIDADTAYLRASIPVIFSDISMGPFGINETHFRHMDSAGSFINASELRHRPQPTYNRANLYCSQSNIGLVFGLDRMYVVHNNQNMGPLTVSSLTQTSGRDSKRNIRDLPYSALGAVRAAPAKLWEYAHDPRAPIPGPTPGAGPDDRPQSPPEYEHPEPPPEPHIGPMAEDLPPEVVHHAADHPDEPLVDQGSLIGLLWKAIEEIADRLDAIEARLPARP
jgi:hypothetical protein